MDELAAIFAARMPTAERDEAFAAIVRWDTFQLASNRILSADLGRIFREQLRREVPADQALRIYGYVVAYHDWLVSTGINSGNPLALHRTIKR